MLAFIFGALGCGRESNLEQIARDEERVLGPIEPPASVYAQLRAIGPVPDGVPAELWADIGWFPGSTQELTLLRGDLHFIVWLRNTLREQLPDCADVGDGIDRYYMVRAGPPADSQTLVFYGSVDRSRVEACAQRFAALVGMQLTFDGPLMVFGEGPDATVVAWAQLGPQTVVISAPSREHATEFLHATGSLTDNPTMLSLLRAPPLDGDTISLGAVDKSGGLLGVPSLGFKFRIMMALDALELSIDGQLSYASAAEATRAKLESEIVGRALGDAGFAVHVRAVEVEGEVLRFDLTVPRDWMSPERLQSVLDTITGLQEERAQGDRPSRASSSTE